MKTKTNKRIQTKKSASKTSNKKQPLNIKADKTTKSVETGIEILKYAIKNQTSVSGAAQKHGLGKNYVSDIKSRIENNLKNRNITRELYTSFKNSSKSYEKASKN